MEGHLEYCAQIQSPEYKNNIVAVEREWIEAGMIGVNLIMTSGSVNQKCSLGKKKL